MKTATIIKSVGTLFAIAILWPVRIIGTGEQGLVTRFGAVQPYTFEPGVHLVVPLIDDVHTFDVRETKEQVESGSASRDLQSVTTVVALNYHLDPSKVQTLFSEVGRQYKDRIVAPAIQESIKQSTAQFSAEELITKRGEVRQKIIESLTEKLARKYIVLDDVSIINFSFSQEFDASIEAKQVAEQNALKAEQDLKRIEVEARQTIESAKAEAESLRLKRESLTAELVELKAIEKWDGKLPQYNTGVLPFINLGTK